MYAVVVSYKAPLEDVLKHVDRHVEWIRRQYAAGHFLISGPQEPRTGGFILAKAMPREQLDGILAEDPYTKAGAIGHTVIEFTPKFADPALGDHVP